MKNNSEFKEIQSEAEFLLEENNPEVQMIKGKKGICPFIKGYFLPTELELGMLVDSGSEVTAMSEDCLQQLGNCGLNVIATLPVSHVTVVGATGARNRNVKKQIIVEVKIANDKVIWISFLIVKGLSVPVVLGADWLQEHGVIINYADSCIEVAKEKFNFGRDQNLGLSCNLRVIVGNEETDEIVFCCNLLEKQFCTREELSDVVLQGGSIDEKTKMKTILENTHRAFANFPGNNFQYECKLEVREHKPFVQKPYPVAHTLRPAVEKEIQNMIENDIIERRSSEYLNPIVVVVKKTGGVRLCIDARKLNKILVPDREAPKPMDELLQKFQGCKYFSKIDLVASYWQIPLAEQSRAYTAFPHQGKTYCFKRLPFGLNVSVSHFIRGLEIVLGPEILEWVTVYVDDILIATRTFEEHGELVQRVLEKLQTGGMTASLKKSEFLKEEICFLGNLVSEHGIRTDPSRVLAIQEFPYPENRKQLERLVGFFNYFRKYIPNFSHICTPLRKLLQKGQSWEWGTEQEEAVTQLKGELSKEILLHHPILEQKFYIACDASEEALGAMLFQIDPEGQQLPICFASRALNAAETGYTVTEKELLSIVFACQKFRIYIYGKETTVLTDHKALCHLHSCKLLHGRITRWVLALQEYCLQIEHVPGKTQIVADALSRSKADIAAIQAREFLIRTFHENFQQARNELRVCVDILEEEALNDPCLSRVIAELKSGQCRDIIKERFRLKDGYVFQKVGEQNPKWVLVIPEKLKEDFSRAMHVECGHYGVTKTVKYLQKYCMFKDMYRTVTKVVGKCLLCAQTKVPNQKCRGIMGHVLATEPLEIVCVDLYGPLPRGKGGLQYILVILDVFTKFVKLYAIKKATAQVVTDKVMDRYVIEIGQPRKIISDNGTQFRSRKWKTLTTVLGIELGYTAVYHPSANPAERVMRELGRLFRLYCHQQHCQWASIVSEVENLINCCWHESTGATPIELMGRGSPRTVLQGYISYPSDDGAVIDPTLDVAQRLEFKAKKRGKVWNSKIHNIVFKEGDTVLVATHHLSSLIDKNIKKFFKIYEGPYVVERVVGHNVYKVNNQNWHVTLLRPFGQ